MIAWLVMASDLHRVKNWQLLVAHDSESNYAVLEESFYHTYTVAILLLLYTVSTTLMCGL